MDKEPKFRLWSKKYLKWIHFTLKVLYDEFGEVSEAGVDWDSLSEFTGFRDKAGTDIYEGDILNEGYADLVHWDRVRGQWMITNRDDADDTLFHFAPDSEVIGSAYRNPELLTK